MKNHYKLNVMHYLCFTFFYIIKFGGGENVSVILMTPNLFKQYQSLFSLYNYEECKSI